MLMLRRLLLCFPLLLSVQFVLAQHHVIKGRLLALPGNLKLSSVAIGYERVFVNRNAVQLLFNRNGVNMSETDGGKDVFLTLIPECKHYFRPLESLHKSAYLAAFLEMRQFSTHGSGFDQDESHIFLHSVERSIAPGLIIGQNLHFSRKWYLEAYTGPLYRFARETNTFSEFGTSILKKNSFSRFGWRFGLNLAYKI